MSSEQPRATEEFPELVILPRNRASRMLMSNSRGARVTHLVSIGAPGEKLPAGFRRIARRLRLEFEDVTDASEGILARHEDVQALISFAGTLTPSSVALLHCEAGISRSTAAALILLASFGGPDALAHGSIAIRATVPEARPNPHMLRLADEILGWPATLTEAGAEVRNFQR